MKQLIISLLALAISSTASGFCSEELGSSALADALPVSSAASAQSRYDLGSPFGWTNSSSLTSGDDYQTTGGGSWNIDPASWTLTPETKAITLQSNGNDMTSDIEKAAQENDIIIFDGSKGDFIISTTMKFLKLKNKSFIGINNARLCTKFQLTPAIHKLMDDNKVLEHPTSGGAEPFILPNGRKVKEECEYYVRKLLIENTGDTKENYRHSGIMQLIGCENIIVRNITFIGPGAIDVGGDDLLTITFGTKHVWVDHCDFTDGMDGNLDIGDFSDFITVSWSIFHYTDLTYVHANTNLVGSNDKPGSQGADNLNVTYAYNCWGAKCNQRMPMVRFGTIHVLNDYYDCAGNRAAINPRFQSEVLVEGNYFNKGVKNIFKANDAKAYQLKDNFYTEKFTQPSDLGTVTVPYKYTVIPTDQVPTEVGNNVGPIGKKN